MTLRRALPVLLGMGMLALPLVPADVAAQRSGVRIGPEESCPPGTTEIRPRLCRAPAVEPPSIVDYRPRSTLVTDENLVAQAKFPVVDVHGHARNLAAPGVMDEMVAALDELNVRVYVAADNLAGARLRRTLDAIAASPHSHRFRVLAGIDFRGVGTSGWGERAARQVEAAVRAGAIGVGEIPKSFGMDITKPDGSRLPVDDPVLDPIWETLARLDVPAFIHTAEPAEFFEPLDYRNERWLELALFPSRRRHGDGPSFEQLMEERDNLFRRHPETTFIAAHFGWHAHDLERAGRMLDEFPNVVVEVGAVLYDLGRQPRAVRDFFTRYQDRILFGKDSFQPGEYPYYWRVFETADEYFDYYRDYHAFWKLYGADLPDGVLRKVYYENARRILPGLPEDGWAERSQH